MGPPKSAKNPRAWPAWQKRQRNATRDYFITAAQSAPKPEDEEEIPPEEDNPAPDLVFHELPDIEIIPESPPIPDNPLGEGDFEEVDLTGNWQKGEEEEEEEIQLIDLVETESEYSEPEEEEKEEEYDNEKPGLSSTLTQAIGSLKRPSGQSTPAKPKRRKISDEEKANWKYVCNICGEKKQCKSQMEQQIHSQIRPYICALRKFDKSICGKPFKQLASLITHIKGVHKGEGKEKVQCPFCLIFLTKRCLPPHLEICGKDKDISCPICTRMQRSELTLYKHLLQCHPGDIQECPICSSPFGSKDQLRMHMQTHAESRFVCHLCPATYQQQTHLCTHLLTRHSTSVHKHICELCPGESSSFPLMRKLVQHLYSAHQSKGIPEDWEEIAEEEEEEMRVAWEKYQDEGDIPHNPLLFGLKYERIAIQLALNAYPDIYSKYTLETQVRVEDPQYKSFGYMDGGLYENGALVGALEVKSLSSLRFKSKEQILKHFKEEFYKDSNGDMRARPNSLYYTQCVFYMKLARINWIDLLLFNLGGPEKSGQIIRIRIEMDIEAEDFFRDKILPIIKNDIKTLKPGKWISYTRNLSYMYLD